MKKNLYHLRNTSFNSPKSLFWGKCGYIWYRCQATALGGAFAAYADDVYAVYYNPAGLTQIKNKQISLGSVNIDPYLKGKKIIE